MTERKVKRVVQGHPAVDGAGVHLQRVLGIRTVEDYDPFLMLDSFDSTNPADYTAGFPMHPHRGIETITFLVEGELEHEDSLGNQGTILPGALQWMTAGSGIMHQEMPQAAPTMLGFQLWLNLPASEKMTEPKYFDITPDEIGVVEEPGKTVRVISGSYHGVTGVTPHHLQAGILDVTLEPGNTFETTFPESETVFVFLLKGDALIGGETYTEKSAVLLADGDTVRVSTAETPLRFQVISGPPIRETVAWGGPIVMNTREELEQAFEDLRRGTFIKERPAV